MLTRKERKKDEHLLATLCELAFGNSCRVLYATATAAAEHLE